jgi:hypothetical protein
MISDVMDPHCVSDRAPSTAPKSITSECSSPVPLLSNPLCREMRLPALAAHCLREINHYRRGEPSTDLYAVELLRRATMEDDQEVWLWVHHCFGGLVRAWLHRHPKRGQRVAWRAKRTLWPRPLNASGRRPPRTNAWNSARWLLPCSTCVRVCMGLFWIHCGRTRGHEKSRYPSQESQENHTWKRAPRAVMSGRSSRRCFQTRVSNGSPTCSFTAVSSPGRSCVCAHRSGVPSMKSMVCDAPSWSDCYAMRTTCDGGSASRVQQSR